LIFSKFCFLLSGAIAALWVILCDQIQEFPQPIEGVMRLILFVILFGTWNVCWCLFGVGNAGQ
jgi:hypothetical protein